MDFWNWNWDDFDFAPIVIDPLIRWFKSYFDLFYQRVVLSLWNMVWRILEGVTGTVKVAFESLWINVSSGFKTIYNFFEHVRDTIATFWRFVTFLKDTWKFLEDFFTNAYNFIEWFILWFVGKDDGFGKWFTEQCQIWLTWLGDFFVELWKRGQDFIFENGLWLYEWVIGIVDKCFGYFIDLIHKIFEVTGIQIDLPAGGFDALMQFVEWGMFFDKFFPIKELFQLLGIYLIFLVMMSLVRFIRSWIPFFH